MTDEQLLNLALDSNQLRPEARSLLTTELSRRGIQGSDIEDYDRDRASWEKENRRNKVDAQLPSLKKMRATLDDWKRFKRRMGHWPLHSIVFYFGHSLVGFAALILIVWYLAEHQWSRGKLLLILLPLTLVYSLVIDRLERRIRASEIARHKPLSLRARGRL